MGPYCQFCALRCFEQVGHIELPQWMNLLLKGVTLLATCPAGKRLDRVKLGFNMDDVQALWRRTP